MGTIIIQVISSYFQVIAQDKKEKAHNNLATYQGQVYVMYYFSHYLVGFNDNTAAANILIQTACPAESTNSNHRG